MTVSWESGWNWWPWHNPASPSDLRKLVATTSQHLFCTAESPFSLDKLATTVPATKGDSYAAAFVVEMWAQMSQNNKHSLEEHLWHVGSKTSNVASLRVARLGWLQSQAKLRHCSWNVKSTIRKAKLPQHKPGSPFENGKLVATYNFAASPFLHYMIST